MAITNISPQNSPFPQFSQDQRRCVIRLVAETMIFNPIDKQFTSSHEIKRVGKELVNLACTCKEFQGFLEDSFKLLNMIREIYNQHHFKEAYIVLKNQPFLKDSLLDSLNQRLSSCSEWFWIVSEVSLSPLTSACLKGISNAYVIGRSRDYKFSPQPLLDSEVLKRSIDLLRSESLLTFPKLKLQIDLPKFQLEENAFSDILKNS